MNAAYRFDDWETPAQESAATMPALDSGKTPKTGGDRNIPATPALAPINAADKRIVNGKADINQLAPFKYPWA